MSYTKNEVIKRLNGEPQTLREGFDELNKDWGNCERCNKRELLAKLTTSLKYPIGICEHCLKQ